MAKIKWKPGTLMSPVPPALVSCGDMDNSNLITVAWTGILSSDPPKTYISLRPSRYSYEIIEKTGEFVINLPSSHIIRSIDFCGVRSGRNVDKFASCRLTKEESFELSCPSVAESPVSLECRVTDKVPLGSHDMFMADIVSVSVDERYIDAAGKLKIEQCSLAAYAHGSYFALGKKIGSFGYSVKKKKKSTGKKR